MRRALVVDTGGLLRAIADRPDGQPAWPDYRAALVAANPIVVPALVLAEVDYFLRHERRAMRRLVSDILDPATAYEMEVILAVDIARALAIDHEFRNLELGLVDCSVAAVAERRRISRILTTDRADFSALRIGPHYRQALTLLP